MERLENFSYRSLERLCRLQAALSSTHEAQRELECMASEYAAMALRQETGRELGRGPAALCRHPDS
jgi:hypothetical protein